MFKEDNLLLSRTVSASAISEPHAHLAEHNFLRKSEETAWAGRVRKILPLRFHGSSRHPADRVQIGAIVSLLGTIGKRSAGVGGRYTDGHGEGNRHCFLTVPDVDNIEVSILCLVLGDGNGYPLLVCPTGDTQGYCGSGGSGGFRCVAFGSNSNVGRKISKTHLL